MIINELLQRQLVWTPELAAAVQHAMKHTSLLRLPAKNRRKAAVLMPLCTVAGELGMLFTVRTDRVSTHKGQVSFPGGHVEPDETGLEAAIRETDEEIPGLQATRKIEVLGSWHEAYAITGTHVSVHVGKLPNDQEMKPLLPSLQVNHREVAAVFALPIRRMLDRRYTYYENLAVEYSRAYREPPADRAARVPVFLGGPARVWGLTAFIAHGFLHDILVPALAEVHGVAPLEVDSDRS